jgi:hypothetical protein
VLHLYVGWIAILAGLLTGTGLGLGFHDAEWLGGYQSWRRRLLRLTHISMVGTGLLNLAVSASAAQLDPAGVPPVSSLALIVGTIAMPGVCALSAWKQPFRHLFFIPVLSLVLAVADFIWEGLLR